MSWFPWSSSGRNESILQDKANFAQTKQQRPSVTHMPLLNKMKRKHGDSSPVSPRLGSPAPKRRTETMSHVQIPAADGQRASLPLQVIPINGFKKPCQTEMPVNQTLNGTQWEGAQDHVSFRDLPTLNRSLDGAFEGGQAGLRRPVSSVADPKALRDTVEAQFGLEILLKHKELRLIDQEFAKCQVALEQLRRCQVIPYPATSSVFEDMQAASSGSGAAFNNRAPYALPWGVATGPYSRHYERWLIPESAFDENIVDLPTPTFGGKNVPDRATRGSKSEKGVVGSKSRSQRGSTSARLKALPHGYPEPKEEKGPMIVKRSSDGKMVKLVCLDCRRSNFNSAQGFINHCRIAHSRQFLSHDAAIEASGEEIDADTEAGLGEIHASQVTASAGLVHPLIRSAHLARNTPTEPATSTSKRKKSQSAATAASQTSATPSTAQAMSMPRAIGPGQLDSFGGNPVPFNPSPQAPHLSALFARMGRGGDLDELVTEATTKPEIDLTLSSDEEDEEEVDNTRQEPDAPQSRSTRGVLRGDEFSARVTRSPSPLEQTPTHPARSNAPSQRPPYLPNITQHAPYSSPYHSDQEQHHGHHTSLLDQQSPFNLSPNTIESHTAPSLVSDDGDYENTHSESESPSSAEADDEDDHYIHAEVMDQDDMDLGEGGSAQDHHLGLGGKPHGQSAGRRSSAMRPPTAIHNAAPEERHVSFASPQRRLRRGSRTKDGH